MDANQIDPILEKLMKGVESSVHAFYRGDVRQHTQRIKTDTFLRDAREALLQLAGGSATVSAGAATAAPSGSSGAAGTSGSMTPDEVTAATRCVMGWMPMGPPASAPAESRCVSAAREMTPTWGEREKARLALKRVAG